MVVGQDVYEAVESFLANLSAASTMELCFGDEVCPQARLEVVGADVVNEFAWKTVGKFCDMGKDDVSIGLSCPVDEQGRLVCLGGKMDGCMAGELEDGWAAHAPVGDK